MIDVAFRNTLLIVLLAILVSVAIIALFILINIVLRMRHDNANLLNQVDKLLNSSHYRDMVSVMDEADQRLRMHRHITDMTDTELQAYVENQFRQKKLYTNPELTLKEAAMKLGVTQEKLRSLFGSDSPLGFFSEYIANLRLSEACYLLKTKNNYTIEAVAKEAGFSSRKTFQTRFKNKFGMTPSQYRLSQSSSNE